jgi:hypothetical protein
MEKGTRTTGAAGVVLFALGLSCCGARGLTARDAAGTAAPERKGAAMTKMDEAKFKDWLTRWEKNIVGDSSNRYCDKAVGEEIAWLMMPFLEGFHQGYVATKDPKWVDRLVDWADSWIKRAVKEPDGYLGWPKAKPAKGDGAAGTAVDNLDDYYADSLLGDAMALRPVVLMAGEILKTPALKEKYGAKAEAYLKLAEETFEKWDKRGAWRDTKEGGCISVVLPFGLEKDGTKWTEGYEKRNAPGAGFSHPDNKANFTARWLLALYDVTQKPVYKERAEKWFRLMKSRLKPKPDGTYAIWNYWEPAGPWDYKPDGKPKHWVGVHPNVGYYSADLEGIVDAYEHGVVFTKEDLDRLIATAMAEKRYWTALAPYHQAIQSKFEESHKPDSWGGLAVTPWYLALQAGLR